MKKEMVIDKLEELYGQIQRVEHDQMEANGVQRAIEVINNMQDGEFIVKPPCKVGDIVYGIFAGRVSECFCIGWKYTGGGLYMICMDRENHQNYSFFDFLFGEMWFLNREEAERVLSTNLNERRA